MERILTRGIYDHLEQLDLLSPFQFGFRANHSVQDQLLFVYNYITSEYDQGNLVEMILFDFKKAFDMVPHSVLLDKLFSLGFRDPLLGWFRDFLTGRNMSVVIGGSISSSRPVSSGVPQGSVVGPLLFIIFVNFLIHDLESKACLFADDLKIYLGTSRDFSTYSEGISALQRDISLLELRAESWGLSFAREKCVRLRFCRQFANNPLPLPLSIGQTPLLCSQSCKDLGVLVDVSLNFHLHISSVVSKAAGVSSNLLRGTLCRSPDFMRTVFITHIRPLLEFASPIWNTDYVTDSRLLESVQRRWTKQIIGFQDLSYYDRLKSLSLFSVWGRLLRADLILVWKICSGQIPNLSHIFSFSHSSTRGHPLKIFVCRSSTEQRKRFFSNRVVKIWNNLSHSTVMSSSLSAFKLGLLDDLSELLYFYHD